MSDELSKSLDANQTIILSYDDAKRAHRVIPLGTLVPVDFDSMQITYLTSGNGTGEIGTVTYYQNGDDIAMLTLAYDSQNRIISVTRI